jgi:hypothetical protein
MLNKQLLPLFFLKLLFLFLIINGTVLNTFAQKTLTSSQFLVANNNYFGEKHNPTNTMFGKYKLPFINQVEFRFDSKNLVLDSQEYSLRFKGNSFKTIDNHYRLYQNKIDIAKTRNKLLKNETLKKRYLLLIDKLFVDKQIALLNKRIVLLKDKIIILSESVYNTNFNVKDLINAEEDLLNAELNLISLKTKNNDLQKLIRVHLNTTKDINITLENLIDPQQIINLHISEFKSNTLDVFLQKLKFENFKNQLQLKKSKSTQLINYVQVKYETGNSLFKKSLSVGLGIDLPFLVNKNQQKEASNLDEINAKGALRNVKKTARFNFIEKQNDLIQAKTNFTMLRKQINESSIFKLLNTYKQMESVSPIILLNLENLIQKKEFELIKIQHQLYKAYIQFLSTNGDLFKQPFKNYLH